MAGIKSIDVEIYDECTFSTGQLETVFRLQDFANFYPDPILSRPKNLKENQIVFLN